MTDRKEQRARNLRTAMILVSIVLALFFGVLVKQALFG